MHALHVIVKYEAQGKIENSVIMSSDYNPVFTRNPCMHARIYRSAYLQSYFLPHLLDTCRKEYITLK